MSMSESGPLPKHQGFLHYSGVAFVFLYQPCARQLQNGKIGKANVTFSIPLLVAFLHFPV